MGDVCERCGATWDITSMRCVDGSLHYSPEPKPYPASTKKYPANCGKCNEYFHCKCAPVKDEWLDNPDGDDAEEGVWLAYDHYMQLHVVTVCMSRKLWWDTCKPGAPSGQSLQAMKAWKRPPPPPVTLPRERQVTLTAKVVRDKFTPDYWGCRFCADGILTVYYGCETLQGAIEIAHSRGIEPEVSDE